MDGALYNQSDSEVARLRGSAASDRLGLAGYALTDQRTELRQLSRGCVTNGDEVIETSLDLVAVESSFALAIVHTHQNGNQRFNRFIAAHASDCFLDLLRLVAEAGRTFFAIGDHEQNTVDHVILIDELFTVGFDRFDRIHRSIHQRGGSTGVELVAVLVVGERGNGSESVHFIHTDTTERGGAKHDVLGFRGFLSRLDHDVRSIFKLALKTTDRPGHIHRHSREAILGVGEGVDVGARKRKTISGCLGIHGDLLLGEVCICGGNAQTLLGHFTDEIVAKLFESTHIGTSIGQKHELLDQIRGVLGELGRNLTDRGGNAVGQGFTGNHDVFITGVQEKLHEVRIHLGGDVVVAFDFSLGSTVVLGEGIASLGEVVHVLALEIHPVLKLGCERGVDIVTGSTDQAVWGPDAEDELTGSFELFGVVEQDLGELGVLAAPLTVLDIGIGDDGERIGVVAVGIHDEHGMCNVDGVVAVEGHDDALDALLIVGDHLGEANHVAIGTGNEQGTGCDIGVGDVPVGIEDRLCAGLAEILLGIDDEQVCAFDCHECFPLV